MKTTNHTPAPWIVKNKDEVFGARKSYNIGTFCVASCQGYKEEREANARLIAAAPELLGALQTVLDYWVDFGEIGCQTLEEAREAIAKAEGGDTK